MPRAQQHGKSQRVVVEAVTEILLAVACILRHLPVLTEKIGVVNNSII